MTAAEKLRALDAVWRDGEFDCIEVCNALPALADVVEAAEAFDFPAVQGDAWRNLSAALSALNEALA